jgi:RNA polymerase sigma factor (sigma-70 family)
MQDSGDLRCPHCGTLVQWPPVECPGCGYCHFTDLDCEQEVITAADLQAMIEALSRYALFIAQIYLFDRSEAEDVVQESFTRFTDRLLHPYTSGHQDTSLTPPNDDDFAKSFMSYRTWLRGFVRNVSFEFNRKLGKTPQPVDEALLPDRFSREMSPDEAEIRRESYDELFAALATLPEIERDSLMAYYLEEETMAAIAQRENVVVSTIQKRISRGLERLRRSIQVTSLMERTND